MSLASDDASDKIIAYMTTVLNKLDFAAYEDALLDLQSEVDARLENLEDDKEAGR